jgi:hypothetical protein
MKKGDHEQTIRLTLLREKGNMIGKNKHPIPGYRDYQIKPNPIPTKRHKTF